MWCPRCDQGFVKTARIINTGEIVRICEECDALWRSDIEVSASNFVDYSQYVMPMGLRGLWNDLEIIQ